ncbi:MAG: hypothetical protein NDI77_15895, partial [Geobacteraceae bacterium]|nr:hypothetical protein [Geobacteraceae bacterium]
YRPFSSCPAFSPVLQETNFIPNLPAPVNYFFQLFSAASSLLNFVFRVEERRLYQTHAAPSTPL